MPAYQLRLTQDWSPETANAISQLAAWGECNEWIVYEHQADEDVSRTHVHAYFFNWAYKIDSFRLRFRQVFGEIDKSNFAISATAGRAMGPITLEGAVRYASKMGTIHAMRVRGYDEEAIRRMEESHKQIPAVKVARKGIQMRRYEQVTSLMSIIDDRTKDGTRLFAGEIYDIIIKWARELGQTLTEYRIMELITTIKVYQGDTQSMKERILAKFQE